MLEIMSSVAKDQTNFICTQPPVIQKYGFDIHFVCKQYEAHEAGFTQHWTGWQHGLPVNGETLENDNRHTRWHITWLDGMYVFTDCPIQGMCSAAEWLLQV